MSLFTSRMHWLATFTAAVWFGNGPVHAQSLVDDFDILFERCRVAIETNSAFENEGFQRRDIADRDVRDWGISSAQEAWMLPESRFYVVLTNWTSRDGPTRHLCGIKLADENLALSAAEQALLLRYFLMRHAELISAGTHESVLHVTPILPSILTGFLLSDRNPNKCTVITTLTFEPDGTFFAAGSGEQATKPCEAE